MKMTVIGKAAAAALVAVLVSGCADEGRVSRLENDVAALKAEVARVKATADKAAADASAALVEARAVAEKVNRIHGRNLRK
jgi:outer membrane murein-binding lipoprotein Lpp